MPLLRLLYGTDAASTPPFPGSFDAGISPSYGTLHMEISTMQVSPDTFAVDARSSSSTSTSFSCLSTWDFCRIVSVYPESAYRLLQESEKIRMSLTGSRTRWKRCSAGLEYSSAPAEKEISTRNITNAVNSVCNFLMTKSYHRKMKLHILLVLIISV